MYKNQINKKTRKINKKNYTVKKIRINKITRRKNNRIKIKTKKGGSSFLKKLEQGIRRQLFTQEEISSQELDEISEIKDKYADFRITTICLENAFKEVNFDMLKREVEALIKKLESKNHQIHITALRELIDEQDKWNTINKIKEESLADTYKNIGEGNFGIVYKNKLKEDNIDVAVKKISDETKIQEFIKEAIITYQICSTTHENLIKMYGIVQNKQQTKYDGIVLEFCSGGDLLRKIKNSVVDDETKKRYIIGICDGMAKIHELNFVHRDLAPRNVLLSSETPKICDFGLSRKKNIKGFFQGDSKVSIFWTDPSAMREEGFFDEKTDIWSFGLTCWQIMKNGADIYPLYMNMLNYDKSSVVHNQIDILGEGIDRTLWDNIKKCFVKKKTRIKNFKELKPKIQ